MKQAELAKQLSDHELRKSVVYSQLLFIIVSCGLSIWSFDEFQDWATIFQWKTKEIVYYGVIPGMGIVIIDFLLMKMLPQESYDDGGINIRIFRNLPIPKIILLTALIAFSEEVLFRGVIQTSIGFWLASILFAIVHIRYLRKPVLLISVILISFLIGYMYVLTQSLYVTIVAHFIVDVLNGLFIRFGIGGIKSGRE